jgi:DNA-binding MarR family transcriptional regulator
MADGSPFKHQRADDSPGFLLWKVTALWQRKLADVLAEFGITQTQYAILASLRWFHEQKEPPTQAHLVDHAKIDKMTLSKAIRQLEEDELVARARSSDDARATHVRLTGRGRKLIQRAVVAVEDADDEFFSCLTNQDRDAYKALMRNILESRTLRGYAAAEPRETSALPLRARAP